MSSVPKGTIAKGGTVARSMANVSGGRGTVVSRPKATAAQRKTALVRRASEAALSGKKVSPAVKNYLKAQQGEKLRMEKTGKGSKAARRMARR